MKTSENCQPGLGFFYFGRKFIHTGSTIYDIMIVTFYNEKIHPDIVKHQKLVFDSLGLNLFQIAPENWTSHGQAVDNFLSGITDDNEIIILFDIDCVPLNREIVVESFFWCRKNLGIVSFAQRANHIPGSIIFAAPAFMAFSMKTYKYLGSPSFKPTSRGDCGAEMTYAARDKGVEVRLLYPTKSIKPVWDLDEISKFGIGTTY